MLSKTVKMGFLFFVTAVFIAGCASTSDSVEETPPPVQPAAATSDTESAVVALETVVYFDFDKSELRPETRALLTAHAAELKSSPRNLTLEGYTDERGTREYNLALGGRRAAATRDYLAAKGVPRSRMRTISYGKERPVAVCDNISCWSQNRRAVTVLSGAGT